MKMEITPASSSTVIIIYVQYYTEIRSACPHGLEGLFLKWLSGEGEFGHHQFNFVRIKMLIKNSII